VKEGKIKIISGGQTGADRAALDFAIAHKIPHGGWCPRGRLAEDGVIPSKYKLIEMKSARYDARTRKNVREADGTVILSTRKEMSGGTLYTFEYAQKKKKPCLCLLGIPVKAAAKQLRQFIQQHHIKVLNVAGPRASKEVRVYATVIQVLSNW
jgi:predicted Rossmann fold nucleotide-binding protein DprA/Smf involved in DNA uptake